MVFAHADILARMILGAALTDDDVARNNSLSAGLLQT